MPSIDTRGTGGLAGASGGSIGAVFGVAVHDEVGCEDINSWVGLSEGGDDEDEADSIEGKEEEGK